MTDYLTTRPHFKKLLGACHGIAPLPTAVVCPEESQALRGALEARDANLLFPILVGDKDRITKTAKSESLDIDGLQIVTAKGEEDAAHKGVDLVSSGEASVLMKGHIHSDIYLSAVLRRNDGLRTTTRTSHCFVLDIPNWDRPIIITDAALNIAPDIQQKLSITQNAIYLCHALGISSPTASILSAVESPTPSLPSSMDAAEIVKLSKSGKIQGGDIDGPFALDNAASKSAAKLKGIESSVAGNTDIYVVPTIESGNIFFKALTFMGGALSAGLVVGASAPIILTSRADSTESRLSSAILSVLYSKFLSSK